MVPIDKIKAMDGSNKFQLVFNYDWLPQQFENIKDHIVSGSGSPILLRDQTHVMASYYKAFKDELSYRAYLDLSDDDAKTYFLVNKADNPVGYYRRLGEGALVLIPPPPEKVDPQKLLGVIIQCASPILEKSFRTPEPAWAKQYSLPGEIELRREVDELQKKIDELSEGQSKKKDDLENLLGFRALLYEKGKPLEDVVIKALRLMGFEAEPFKKDDMEHDIVLNAPEGIAVVEVKGKDDDAIKVEKFDQLTRVVDEHFEEHSFYPEGILVGNPYRFKQPVERPDPFSDKTRKAAERKGFSLLTTAKIFEIAVRLLERPNDEDFKTSCRKAILSAKGEEVKFPI